MRTKIKVICLIGQLGNGGTERQLYLFLKHLDRGKFKPTVVVSSKSGGSRWEKQIREELSIPINFLGSLPKAAKFAKFAWTVLKNRADIVFSWSFYTNAFCMACPGTEFIGSLRGDLHMAKAQLSNSNFKYSLKPSRFVVNSNHLRDELKLEGIAENRISVIYNIFPSEENLCETRKTETRIRLREQYHIPQDAIVVAGIGRSCPEKDFQFFVSVFKKAFSSNKKLFGLLVGNIGSEIKNEIGMMKLEDSFVLTGEVESARALLPAADIFFLSSKSEGLPNALLEAIDAGCAVLATDVGGVREVIEPYGEEITGRILIGNRDVDGAAAKLVFLAENLDFRKDVSSRRMEALAKYGPENIMSEYNKLLTH